MPFTLSIVEDDPVIRASWIKIINRSPGYRCVGDYGSAVAGRIDEVMGSAVLDLGELADRKPGVLMMPAVHEFADDRLHEPGQIPSDMGRVFAGKLY